jgi:CxxC-x17-CxxC domain-containing protein
MPFADKTLTCRDCGTSFTFTVGEQEFHAQKGFTNEPGRCPDCRARRRSERGDSSPRGGGSSYGGQRELFTTTCSSCGKEAQVPFQPRGDKPVYCSDCYRSQQGSRSSGGGNRSSGYSDRGSRW